MKLVRGAYHPHELAAHPSTGKSSHSDDPSVASAHSLSISPDTEPPVWMDKADTDERYNACVRVLVAAVRDDVQRGAGRTPAIGVLFGTHNWVSARLIPEELVRQGLAHVEADGTIVIGDEVAERVTMGQLYGKSVFYYRQFAGLTPTCAGMMAALTNDLVDRVRSSSPFVIKYIPYGALSEVRVYICGRC